MNYVMDGVDGEDRNGAYRRSRDHLVFLYLRTKENRFRPSIPMQSPYLWMFYGSLDLLMCLLIAVNCEAGTCRVNGLGKLGFPVNPRDRLHQQAVEIRKQSMETRRTCLAPTSREPLKIRLKEAEGLEGAHGIELVVFSTQSIIGFGSSSMQRWLTLILYIKKKNARTLSTRTTASLNSHNPASVNLRERERGAD